MQTAAGAWSLQCYRRLETAAGFKASKTFRNHLDKVLIVIEKVITGGEEVEFLPPDFGDILANLTTTSRVMNKSMLRVGFGKLNR